MKNNFSKFFSNFINYSRNNKANVVIIISLVLLFFLMVLKDNGNLFKPVYKNKVVIEQYQKIKSNEVVIFHQPTCHSCQKEIKYLKKIKRRYPGVKFKYYDITLPKNMAIMKQYFKRYKIPPSELVTPTTFIADDYLLGFESVETSGKSLDQLIEKNFVGVENKLVINTELGSNSKFNNIPEYIDTLFGRINVKEQSLLVLAVTMGLADGFNPCAMWVLVYLISLVVGLKDRRKIWLIVGTFLLASGVIYFLLMTALLNVFMYIGYLRILELFFGCIALYVGLTNLKVYIFDKGQANCKVANDASKQKTKSLIKRIVESKISVFTVLAMIGLAFVVNSMEFVCSAALPAIYTSILAQAKLPIFTYYLYIGLYICFFLLDDFIIFATAAFAVNKYLDEKYIVPFQILGGLILFCLGIIMIFFPYLLK